MKTKRIVLFGISCCLVVFCMQACSKSISQESELKSLLFGAWEYMLDDHEGLAIYSETYFIFFATPKRDSTEKSELTDLDKLDIYNGMIATAGTYTVSDTIVTCNVVYHRNPNQVGTRTRFTIKMDGDVGTYSIINDEGEITFTGKARKIE